MTCRCLARKRGDCIRVMRQVAFHKSQMNSIFGYFRNGRVEQRHGERQASLANLSIWTASRALLITHHRITCCMLHRAWLWQQGIRHAGCMYQRNKRLVDTNHELKFPVTRHDDWRQLQYVQTTVLSVAKTAKVKCELRNVGNESSSTIVIARALRYKPAFDLLEVFRMILFLSPVNVFHCMRLRATNCFAAYWFFNHRPKKCSVGNKGKGRDHTTALQSHIVHSNHNVAYWGDRSMLGRKL